MRLSIPVQHTHPPRLVPLGKAVFCLAFALFFLEALWLFHHALYRAPDMALFDQAIWNTSQGRWFACAIQGFPFLGEHFAISLALLVPLYWLAPWSGWLLLVQALALASIGWAVFKLALDKGLPGYWPLALQIAATLQPGLLAVNRSNFHANSLAAALLVWTLYFFSRRKDFMALSFLFLFLGCQEDFGLVSVGAGLTLLAQAWWENRKAFPWRKAQPGMLMILLSVLWVVAVNEGAMDAYEPYPDYHGIMVRDRYGFESLTFLGQMGEILYRPGEFFGRLLDTGHLTFVALLFWGVYGLPLLWPPGWIALVLAFLPNLFSKHDLQYDLEYYYQSLLVGLLAFYSVYGAAKAAAWLEGWKGSLARLIPSLLVALVLAQAALFTYQLIGPLIPPAKGRHLPAALAEVKTLIPPGASVASSINIAVHFCHNEQFTLYPNPKKADWVVIDTGIPLNVEITRKELLESGEYEIVLRHMPLIVFRKR